jgi:hypothetical protein
MTQQLNEAQLLNVQNTLVLAMDQLMLEMAKAGGVGGTGRIQQYAPVLVNLNWCKDIVEAKLEPLVEARLAFEAQERKRLEQEAAAEKARAAEEAAQAKRAKQ